jgi:hypothetical protein
LLLDSSIENTLCETRFNWKLKKNGWSSGIWGWNEGFSWF